MNVGDPERAPVCTTDQTAYSQHVLYAYNQGATNRLATVTPAIQAQIRRTDYVLDQESLLSGSKHADYRVLCTTGGAIYVRAFAVPPGSGGIAQSSFSN